MHRTCLLNLVPGPGNNGVGVIKFTVVRSMFSLSMTILVYDPADREHYTKEWRFDFVAKSETLWPCGNLIKILWLRNLQPNTSFMQCKTMKLV